MYCFEPVTPRCGFLHSLPLFTPLGVPKDRMLGFYGVLQTAARSCRRSGIFLQLQPCLQPCGAVMSPWMSWGQSHQQRREAQSNWGGDLTSPRSDACPTLTAVSSSLSHIWLMEVCKMWHFLTTPGKKCFPTPFLPEAGDTSVTCTWFHCQSKGGLRQRSSRTPGLISGSTCKVTLACAYAPHPHHWHFLSPSTFVSRLQEGKWDHF